MTSELHPEIESLQDLDTYLAQWPSLAGVTLQSVDLTQRAEQISSVSVRGAVFLGCAMSGALQHDIVARGALVFPRLPKLAFNPYRADLYTAGELYNSLVHFRSPYALSLDASVYNWYSAQPHPHPISASLAMSLHDHAISDALDELFNSIPANRTIGMMGGHAVARGEDAYYAAAQLGSKLAHAGYTVVTGGGPGAMEAANLGARLSRRPTAINNAIKMLAKVPSFKLDITAWAQVALDVAARYKLAVPNIGIPTWYYGHEPPNVFGTAIAKFFNNAIREDTLLDRCRGGIVYLPGAAGTVQEIFQASTRNYYAADAAATSPMVLVGVEHWTKKLPAWKLLQALGNNRPMGDKLALVDSIEEAAEVLLR